MDDYTELNNPQYSICKDDGRKLLKTYTELDEVFKGFPSGSFIEIGGEPDSGKTLFVSRLLQAYIYKNIPCFIINSTGELEMNLYKNDKISKEQLQKAIFLSNSKDILKFISTVDFPCVIFIDSILEIIMEPKEESDYYKKLYRNIYNKNICIIFTNNYISIERYGVWANKSYGYSLFRSLIGTIINLEKVRIRGNIIEMKATVERGQYQRPVSKLIKIKI